MEAQATETPVMTIAMVNGSKTTKGSKNPVNGAPNSSARKPLDLRRFGLDETLSTSYPTRSLEFLKRLNRAPSHAEERQKNVTTPPGQARTMLNVVIIGAGLGGLSAAVALARSGHSVEVLEQAPALGEVSLYP